ncbi:MAG: hypothetical protein M5R36_21510 [Deltaproteobacteria bacterium]|nr:hypothetical protein [Deltaproteobacteria bacterium]
MESFADVFPRLDRKGWRRAMDETSTDDVRRVLAKGRWTVADASTLFSKAAAECLEETARLAAALTERRFGKVIQLYVPLYLQTSARTFAAIAAFRWIWIFPACRWAWTRRSARRNICTRKDSGMFCC